MRTRRALVSLALAASFAVTSVASGHSTRAASVVTLRWSFWSNNPAEIHSNQSIINAFEAQNPGIKIDPLFIPYASYHTKVLAEAIGGNAPDVMWIQYTYYRNFADKGALLDITDRVSKDTGLQHLLKTDTYPIDAAKIYYKNHVFGLVRDDEGLTLAYNTDMFKKAGLPTPNDYAAKGQWNWNTFLTVAKKLTLKSGSQVTQYGTSPADYLDLLYLNGGSLFNSNLSKMLIDSPQAIQAVQFAADLMQKYKVAPVQAESAAGPDYFGAKRVAMSWNAGPWLAPGYNQIKGLHWDVAPFPTAPGKSYRLPADNGAFYTISATSKHPNEAYKLVRFMVSPTAQKLMAKALTTSPLLKSVMYSKAYLTAPGMPVHGVLFAKENESLVPLVFPNNWLQVQQKCNGYLDQSYLGQSTGAKLLPQGAHDLDSKLAH
jgi:multiple sugar transport system substrate-binding protein